MMDDTFSVMCKGARYLPMPTTLVPEIERNRILALPNSNRLHRWDDAWYDLWDGEPYLFGNHTGTNLGRIDPPPFWPTQLTSEPMADPRFETPAVDWVYQFDVKAGGKKQLPYFGALVRQDITYWLRYKYIGAGVTFAASMSFFDIDGDLIYKTTSTEMPSSGGGSGWAAAGPFNITAPPTSRYLSWEIVMTGAGVAALGAISITDYRPAAYRDPRAIAVMLNTGAAEVQSTDGTLMEDPVVTMESALKTMEDGGTVTVVQSSLESYEKIIIAKLYGILDLYVPSGVQTVVLTPDNPEFEPLWEQGYQYSPQ
jgi:hypothetical protein